MNDVIFVRVPPHMKEAVRAEADARLMTMSDVVRQILMAYYQAREVDHGDLGQERGRESHEGIGG